MMGCQLNRTCYISSESSQGGDYNVPILGENDAVVLEVRHEWCKDVAVGMIGFLGK